VIRLLCSTPGGSRIGVILRIVGSDNFFSGNSTASGDRGGAAYVGLSNPACTTGDTLNLANSIVNGNSPQPEIHGFGMLALQYSDVCAESGGPAVPAGAGDICANPNLTAAGAETASSPTVDAGSNPLVPAGLSTDITGAARIRAWRETCAGLGPSVVDMGAAEATFTIPVTGCPLPFVPSITSVLSGVSQSAAKWLESSKLASISKATKKKETPGRDDLHPSSCPRKPPSSSSSSTRSPDGAAERSASPRPSTTPRRRTSRSPSPRGS